MDGKIYQSDGVWCENVRCSDRAGGLQLTLSPSVRGCHGDPRRTFRPVERAARKALWWSSLTIHHAHQVRPTRRMKVGGHQASFRLVADIMSVAVFRRAAAEDRVAIKPHASPVFHAIQYLFRTPDRDRWDSAASQVHSPTVGTKGYRRSRFLHRLGRGLGVAQTHSLPRGQDYVKVAGWMKDRREGADDRAGSAMPKMDEGNIFGALWKAKHGLRNTGGGRLHRQRSIRGARGMVGFLEIETMFRNSAGRGDREIRLVIAKPSRAWAEAAEALDDKTARTDVCRAVFGRGGVPASICGRHRRQGPVSARSTPTATTNCCAEVQFGGTTWRACGGVRGVDKTSVLHRLHHQGVGWQFQGHKDNPAA